MAVRVQHRVPEPRIAQPEPTVTKSSSSSRGPRRGASPVLIVGLFVSLFGSGWSGCGADSDVELPVLGSVPDFTLVERSGRTVRASDLRGHIWVANFIFTRCPSICPGLSARMAVLQSTISREEASAEEVNKGPESSTDRPSAAPDAVRLVSFSVDPEHDTTEVLRLYADRFHADPDRWLFLTGSRARIHQLVRDGFRLGLGEPEADDPAKTSMPILHSDRFVLVDPRMRIRGYYPALEEEGLTELTRQIGKLRRQKPPP